MPLSRSRRARYPWRMALSISQTPDPPLIHLSSDYIRAKEYLEAIVNSTSDAICTTDVRGRIIYFSPGAERMVGARGAEMVGRPAHELYLGGREDAERIMRILRRDGAMQDHEMVLKTMDGRHVHISMSAAFLKDRAGRVIGTLGVSKDITRRVELERRLRALSVTDALTGLFNKRHFEDRLLQESRRARRQRYRLSLVLIDLDGFKRLNDERGHLEGDRLLRAFGSAVARSIRAGVDSAYRTGGDEFAILLPGLTTKQAEPVARRVEELASRLSRDGVGLSWGISALPAAGAGEAMVRAADERMYKMKRSRRRGGRPERSPSQLR